MKKLLSTVLALLLMLSLSVPAFAEVTVDGDPKGTGEVTVDGDAGYVIANASGDDLTVNGKVAGDDSVRDSVFATSSAKVTVSESVTKTDDRPDFAVRANTGDVTVKKDVTESGDGDAIYTSNNGNVVVGGDVSESDDGSAIQAYFGSTVKVTGNVSEDGKGNAVSASSGASVTVEGNVTESGEGFAVNASGAETIVTVNGNVDESGTGSALQAVEATIIVIGNVEEKNAGTAITAAKNATVIVGGNVTDGVETAGASDAVTSGFGATVIVEGLVTGQLNTNGQTNSGTIYIGELNGDIREDADLSKIHYLIGVAPEGSAALSAVTLVSDIVADGTIDGVNEKGYKYTTTADTTALNDKTIILKPADGKILTVSGFDGANVTYVANEDGTVTFTIGDSFTGGLQNLVLVLANKPGPTPGPDPDPAPVYYIVPAGSVTVVEFTAPEGVEEGLIKALDSADHAGLTVDSSLVGDGSVKVLKDGEELSAKDFSIYTHADGSIDIILSNTYLFALGSGSYDFTAIVGGLEIPFTVAIAI